MSGHEHSARNPAKGRDVPRRSLARTAALSTERKNWISPSPDRAAFRIRSASPSLRYSSRRRSGALSLDGQCTDQQTLSARSPQSERKLDVSGEDVPSPSVIERATCFSSSNRQPWRKEVTPDGKDNAEEESDAKSMEDLSLPSDASSLKSGSQIRKFTLGPRSNSGRDKSKCSSFQSDAAPFQLRRGKDSRSSRSLGSESSLFTPSIQEAARAIHDHSAFENECQQKSSSRWSDNGAPSSISAYFGRGNKDQVQLTAEAESIMSLMGPLASVNSNLTPNATSCDSSCAVGHLVEVVSPSAQDNNSCSSRLSINPKTVIPECTQCSLEEEFYALTSKDKNLNPQDYIPEAMSRPSVLISVSDTAVGNRYPYWSNEDYRVNEVDASSYGNGGDVLADQTPHSTSKSPPFPSVLRTSSLSGSHEVESNASGRKFAEAQSAVNSPERRKVHFSQEWLKEGDEYDEEKYRQASLLSLVYTGNDVDFEPPREACVQSKKQLVAPSSPDISRSSVSFTHSLDATDGSSLAGVRNSESKELKTPNGSLNFMSLPTLPKIDEKISAWSSFNTSLQAAAKDHVTSDAVEIEPSAPSSADRIQHSIPTHKPFEVEDDYSGIFSESIETVESPMISPSPRDMILQRRKRLASPGNNPILQQEDSSQESKIKNVPKTITVDHLGCALSINLTVAEPFDKSETVSSLSAGHATLSSPVEAVQKIKPQVLELEGMSLIERDNVSAEGLDDGSSSDPQVIDSFGFPCSPLNRFIPLEESSKSNSLFSKKSEDLFYLLPKEQPKSIEEPTICCSRNRFIVTIVVAALLAVCASTTVVALMLVQRRQQQIPPVVQASNQGQSRTPWGNGPPKAPESTNSTTRDDPQIVLMSPDDSKPSSGSAIDDFLYGPVSEFNISKWHQVGSNINAPSDSQIAGYNFAFAFSGNGKRLAVGFPHDHTNGENSGALFLYQLNNVSMQWDLLGLLLGEEPGNVLGLNVALDDLGAVLAVTSESNRTKIVQVFDIENINKEVKRQSNVLRALSHRKHEPLYDHDRYPDLVHQVHFVSKALNHLKLEKEYWLDLSVFLSDKGTVLGVISNPHETISDSKGNVSMFQYDEQDDKWKSLEIGFPDSFSQKDLWASGCVSGDGHILALSNSQEYKDASGEDSLKRSVLIFKRGGYSQPFEISNVLTAGELLRAEIISSEMLNATDAFGESLAISYNGSLLAIGFPSQEVYGFALVLKAQQDTDGSLSWVQAGDVLSGASREFGSTLDISADGLHLVVGSKKTVISDTGAFGIYELNLKDNLWVKAPDINYEESDGEIIGVAISSDGTRVATGITGVIDQEQSIVQVFEIKSS